MVSLSVPETYTKEDLLNRLGLPIYYYAGDISEGLQDNDIVHLEELIILQDNIETITTFETVTTFSHLLFADEEEIEEGRVGKELHNVISIFHGNEEVTRHIIETIVIHEAKDAVITRGLRLEAVDVEATAYSPEQPGLSNYTATGIRAEHGVIAVDPSVIPLGTYVYIPGYGVAIAADTGGAIRGNKIDVAFDTVAEAWQFGRQRITIYILDQFRDLGR